MDGWICHDKLEKEELLRELEEKVDRSSVCYGNLCRFLTMIRIPFSGDGLHELAGKTWPT
jgi:hypothetical protein